MSQTSVARISYRRCRGYADFQSYKPAEELEQQAYFIMRGCRLIYLSSLYTRQMLERRCNLSPRLAHMGNYVSEHLSPRESTESCSEERQFNTAGSQHKPRKDAVGMQDNTMLLNLFRTLLFLIQLQTSITFNNLIRLAARSPELTGY